MKPSTEDAWRLLVWTSSQSTLSWNKYPPWEKKKGEFTEVQVLEEGEIPEWGYPGIYKWQCLIQTNFWNDWNNTNLNAPVAKYPWDMETFQDQAVRISSTSVAPQSAGVPSVMWRVQSMKWMITWDPPMLQENWPSTVPLRLWPLTGISYLSLSQQPGPTLFQVSWTYMQVFSVAQWGTQGFGQRHSYWQRQTTRHEVNFKNFNELFYKVFF